MRYEGRDNVKSGKNSVWDRCPQCGATVEIEVPDARHPRERRKDLRWRRRRWLTRIALVLLLVFAGLNGWMVVRYSEELQTVAAISSNRQGEVNFGVLPLGPKWFKRWILYHDLPFLQTVVSVEDHHPTDRVLELASDLPGLYLLDLDNAQTSEITDQGMTYLRDMSLYQLSIGGPKITDTGLYYLRNMTSLRALKISGCPQLTDAGIAHLAGLKGLMHLEIRDAPQLTDAGLAALRNMKNLRTLKIFGASQLTGEGFAHLKGLKDLMLLSIEDVPQLTDEGLESLRSLENLESLSIVGAPQLTDAGLEHIAQMKSLSDVNLGDHSQLTKDGIAALQKALPGVAITINWQRVTVKE